MDEELSAEETALWHAWKKATEAVMTGVGRDIEAATGLSGPDFGVLSRLVDLGDGKLRQQDLADSMSWDKSRLSHHLSRMEERGLVRRDAASGRLVFILITPEGRRALRKARPVHAASVRRRLLAGLTSEEHALLSRVLHRITVGG